MTEKNITLFLEGGGMKATVVGGMALALNQVSDKFSISDAKSIYATSGSVGNLMYSLSERCAGDSTAAYKKAFELVWTELLTDPKFINRSRNGLLGPDPIIDLDYLTNYLFRQKAPLDEAKIREVSQGWAFPCYCIKTHQTVFVCNEIGSEHCPAEYQKYVVTEKDDIYHLIAAAKAAPVISNEVYSVGPYELVDGALEFPIPFVPFEGKAIVMLSSPKTGIRKGVSSFVGSAVVGNVLQLRKTDRLPPSILVKTGMRKFVRYNMIKQIEQLEKSGDVLIIEPIRSVGSTGDNRSETIWSNYQTGLESVAVIEEKIKAFINA